jgi:leucyl aminopeptidase
VVPFIDKKIFSHSHSRAINTNLDRFAKNLLKKSGYKGEKGQNKLIPTLEQWKFDYLLIVGLGDSKKLTLEDLRRAAAQAVKEAEANKVKRVLSLLSLVSLPKQNVSAVVQALAEGSLLGGYRFEKFKGKKGDKLTLNTVSLVVSGATKPDGVKNVEMRGRRDGKGSGQHPFP